MKKIVGLVLALGLAHIGLGQDIIHTVSGEELKVKVKKVTNTEVIYQVFGDTTSAENRIAMDQVRMVKLEKGAANPEVFNTLDKAHYVVSAGNAGQYSLQGKADARNLYKGRGAMWGTFAATALFPPAGLVTGTVVALTPPEIQNLPLDPALRNDPDYMKAFKKQAHNKKAGKTAAGFGLGLVAYTILYTALVIILFIGLG